MVDGGVNRWCILATVRLIRECRRRCLPGGARVCSRAATVKSLVAADDYDIFWIWEVVYFTLHVFLNLLVGRYASSRFGSLHLLRSQPRLNRAASGAAELPGAARVAIDARQQDTPSTRGMWQSSARRSARPPGSEGGSAAGSAGFLRHLARRPEHAQEHRRLRENRPKASRMSREGSGGTPARRTAAATASRSPGRSSSRNRSWQCITKASSALPPQISSRPCSASSFRQQRRRRASARRSEPRPRSPRTLEPRPRPHRHSEQAPRRPRAPTPARLD